MPDNFFFFCRSATDQKYFPKHAGYGRGGAGVLPTVVPDHPVSHHAVLHIHLVAVVVQITRGRIVVEAQLRDHPVWINMDLENRRKKTGLGDIQGIPRPHGQYKCQLRETISYDVRNGLPAKQWILQTSGT